MAAANTDNLLNSKLNVRMGKKGDLSNFERGMVVGARVFHNLLSYWDFHTQPFLGFTKNGVNGKNIQSVAVLWAKMTC